MMFQRTPAGPAKGLFRLQDRAFDQKHLLWMHLARSESQ